MFPDCRTGEGQYDEHNREGNIYAGSHDDLNGMPHEVAAQLGGGDGYIKTKEQVVKASNTGEDEHKEAAFQEGIKSEQNPNCKKDD